MPRIHSESVCLFALATLENDAASLFVKRIGTILPFACPLGRRGLPGFLCFWF